MKASLTETSWLCSDSSCWSTGATSSYARFLLNFEVVETEEVLHISLADLAFVGDLTGCTQIQLILIVVDQFERYNVNPALRTP